VWLKDVWNVLVSVSNRVFCVCVCRLRTVSVYKIIGYIVVDRWLDVYGVLVERHLAVKSCPITTWSMSQIARELAWNRTRASVLRRRRQSVYLSLSLVTLLWARNSKRFWFFFYIYFPLCASLLISNNIPTMTARIPIYIHLFGFTLPDAFSCFLCPWSWCAQKTPKRVGQGESKKVNINWNSCSHSWYIVR
jgi:hypothetical protein